MHSFILAVNMNEGVTKQHPRGLFWCRYLCLTLPFDTVTQTQGGRVRKDGFHLEPSEHYNTCVVLYIETQKMITDRVGDDRMLLVMARAICILQKSISTFVKKVY